MLQSITIQTGRSEQSDCGSGCRQWAALLAAPPAGSFLGRTQEAWRRQTREELNLETVRPIVATGHQTLLWHPGILTKYLALEMYAKRDDIARANLIVDQHAGPFGQVAVPLRRADGSLHLRTISLTTHRPDVPMAMHDAFDPQPLPDGFQTPWPCVDEGIQRIIQSVSAHRDAPNAAVQMGLALADLMSPWVGSMSHVTATQLQHTSLCRALLTAMVDDPHRCAAAYNRAVEVVPEGGVSPLRVSHDYVELPLWRIGPDGVRVRAFDHDVEQWLEGGSDVPAMLPRALLMTALIRLGMCDLFIHGTGGARYDRAMELWLQDWLGVHPAPLAVATATVSLDLRTGTDSVSDVHTSRTDLRRLWHDPNGHSDRPHPSAVKQRQLDAINAAPHGSAERRAAFFHLHTQLAEGRAERKTDLNEAAARLDGAMQQETDARIADRRDWAFPLYPREAIDELADAVGGRIQADCAAPLL